MSWYARVNESSQRWLLEECGPAVRYLALRELTALPEGDPELVDAISAVHTQGPIGTILSAMDPAGYWVEPGPGYLPKYRSTVWAIILLAQLGARVEQDERIAQGCAYLLDHALAPGGKFSINGAPSGTVDCLQGNLCWALRELGFEDPRLEQTFEWMARSVTGEGLAPNTDRQAPLRYYAGKCGPGFACGANNTLPCAWGAVKVLLAFSSLPAVDRTPMIQRAIQQGIDFIFSVDPATAAYPTGYSDKPSRNWWKYGFPVFYITDLLQLVEAVARLGYGQDPRLEHAITTILEGQDEQGCWTLGFGYAGKTWLDFGPLKQPNPWVSLRALRTLKLTG